MLNYSFIDLLTIMVNNNSSDLIIKVGSPIFRINRFLQRAQLDTLAADDTYELTKQALSEDNFSELKVKFEKDAAYALSDIARFRINAFHQQGNYAMVIRLIKAEVPRIEKLTLPEIIYNISCIERGLVLVTGTTGSGKSTTLAAMINYMNENLNKHIITIEDPIEFVHKDKSCIVTQREVGFDTKTFHTALVAAMRQNPDVILIGEMRDSETVDAALAAAETGHLVMSTLHTINAAQTINRILEFYEKDHHDQLRSQLAEYLMATISQRLVPKVDNSGVVPAIEIMFQTPMIKKLIVDNRIDKLKSIIHQGNNEGMQTFDQSLVSLFKAGLVSEEEAAIRCTKPANFKLYCEGHYPDVEAGIV